MEHENGHGCRVRSACEGEYLADSLRRLELSPCSIPTGVVVYAVSLFYPLLKEMHQSGVNQRTSKVKGFDLGNVGPHKMPDNEINLHCRNRVLA